MMQFEIIFLQHMLDEDVRNITSITFHRTKKLMRVKIQPQIINHPVMSLDIYPSQHI